MRNPRSSFYPALNYFLLLFAFCFSNYYVSSAQGVWSQKASVSAAGREGSVGFSIGQKGYMGTGLNMGYKDFWEWNKATNTWNQKASIPAIERAEGIGFSIGTKGYIGMGWNTAGAGGADTMYNDLYEWNQATNTWTSKANFPGSYGRAGSTAFSIGTKGYVGCGSDTITTYNDWWEFDPGANSWTQKGNFPGGARWFGCGITLGTKGYLACGNAGLSLKKDLWEYDPSGDSWSQKTNMPGAGRWQTAGFAICNRIYVGTGSTDVFLSNNVQDFYQWDPASNTWSQVANFGGAARREETYFSIGDTGYVACGGGAATFPITNYSDLWEFHSPFAPTAVFTASPVPFCEGQCTNFTDNSTGTIHFWNWSFQGGAPSASSTQNPAGICFASSGTHSVQLIISDTARCGGSDTTTLSIQVDSMPVADAGTGATICLGSSTVLNASGGTTYSWSPTTNLSCSTCASTLASPTTTTLYTVTATNTCGSDQDTVTVTVGGSGGPSLTPSSNNADCGSCNGTASVSVSSGTPPYTYSWSNGSTSSSATGLCQGSASVTVTSAPGADVTFWNEDFTAGVGSWTLNTSSGTNGAKANSWVVNSFSNCACGTGNYLHITCDQSVFICSAASGGSADCYYYPGAFLQGDATTDKMAVSDNISTMGKSNITLRFKWMADGDPTKDYGKVRLSDDGGTTWTDLTAEYSGATSCGTATVSVPSLYENQTDFRIAFRWKNNNDFNGSDPPFGIDDIELLTPGTAGCASSTSITVNQNSSLNLSTGSTNTACGLNTGTATATPNNGTSPFTYNWSIGQTTQTATGLPIGNIDVTVTDAGGCSAAASVTINSNNGPSVTTASSPATCGASNGNATANASGGTTPYTYLWTGGQTTSTATGLPAGTYSVTVYDAGTCTVTTSATVSGTGAPSATTSTTNATCGSNNGTATANASGGTIPYTYLWTGGQTTSTATALAAGNYDVTVTDGGGCTVTASATVPGTGNPAAATSSTAAACGNNDGTATVNASGGTLPYSYLWSDGQTVSNATALAAGNYDVTVTDGGGCTVIASATVSGTNGPTATASSTGAACGNNDGTATVNTAGGTLPYTYLWSDGQTASTATGLAAGNYNVTVTDGEGCSVTTSTSVTNTSGPTVTTSATIAACGNNNGTATANASGGTLPYTYLWSDGQTASTATGLPPGSISVTVTDGGGCAAPATETVPGTGVPLSVLSSTNISCSGNSDGIVTETASGGTPPYTYSWSGGQTTSVATGLSPITVYITVTDANTCSVTDSVVLTEPTPLNISFSITNSTCGSNNGQVTATISGGTGSYSYLWSNSATTSSIANLIAGSYSLTVTDGNGCTLSDVAAVGGSGGASVLLNAGINVSCNGGNDGSLDISASGGTAPYTFNWSNGFSTEDISSLAAGIYSVSVTDSVNCLTVENYIVTEPPPIVLTGNKIDASCGSSDGAAWVDASGGTPGYSYLWSNSATADSILGIPAANYSVTVTDNKGCTQATTISVNEAGAATVNIDSVTGIPCNGGNTGSIAIAISGGTLPYTYLWSNSATTQNISGLTAGNYLVTVADASGCQGFQSAAVTEPAALVVAMNTTVIPCTGTGSATASVSGGTGGYTYLWSNGSTTSVVSNVNPGVYFITVTDGNACTATDSAVITGTGGAILSLSNIVSVTCNGGADGSITVNISGGTPPYSYIWSNGSSALNISGVGAGDYSITLTDGAGCTDADTFTITEPAAMVIAGYETDAGCGASNGSAWVIASGGTPGYSYLWSNGSFNDTISGIPAGIYLVTVTDNNGCSQTDAVTVSEAGAALLSINSANNVSCFGGNDGSIDLEVSGGSPPYAYNWSNGSTTQDLNGLDSGVYSVTVSGGDSCISAISATITQPSAIVISATGTDATCTVLGTATVSASGGTPSYTYFWTGGQTSSSASGLIASAYVVTVTDANGCTETDTATISQTGSITATLAGDSEICPGSNVILDAGGGSTYLWFDGSADSTLAVNPGTTTTYYVIAFAGPCTDTAFFTVAVDTAVIVDAGNDTAVYIGDDALLHAEVTGGISPFTYLWNPGNGQQEDITVSPSSTTAYYVSVTDANGCMSKDSVVVDILPCDAEVFVPNAFAPGCKCPDSKLKVYSDCILTLQFFIYDRWGERIWETEDITKGWDGTYHGKPMDAAVYVYYLKYTSINEPDKEVIMEGNVNLVR